ncbi:MAG: hypothetical protein ACLFRB_08040 [Thiohalorhabdus sp.]|uniref:hypothetical protein n=1 Tax=Thiohalorhabdus sp. TaxID=3094134 RepID=UPI0039806DB9
MDTLSHTLWGGGLFGFRGRIKTALFFGAFPDLVSFGPWFAGRLLTGQFGGHDGPPPLEILPGWVFTNYAWGHSLVVAGLCAALAWRYHRPLGFAMLAWPLHILVDIPTHTAAYFPTPFLWPLSGYTVDGVSWAQPWVWYPNLTALLLVFLGRWYNRRPASPESR